MDGQWDCIIVGAGPAGLSAALYMARFRRRVLVVHDGRSRALRIPMTHNVPGFPDGVEGAALVERMLRHARRYGAQLLEAEVVQASRGGAGFVLTLADSREELRCCSLILATGLYLQQAPLEDEVHEAALRAGVLRYCPVCDGYEHTGQRIGVLGADGHGASEALFLRGFSSHVTLVPLNSSQLGAGDIKRLQSAGVEVLDGAVTRHAPTDDCYEVQVEGRQAPLSFDVMYPALGVRQRTELALMLGLELGEAGSTAADSPLGTAIPGLYCAGDIVEGLDQISVAMGHGALAATRAHNWLRDLLREPPTLDTAPDPSKQVKGEVGPERFGEPR